MSSNSKATNARVDRPELNADQLREMLKWFFGDISFGCLRLHGNTRWSPVMLVSHVLLWMWSECPTLTAAFSVSLANIKGLYRDDALSTYAGLAAALERVTPILMPLLKVCLHKRMQQVAGQFWRDDKWVVIGIDGSRVTVPRTESNEQANCAKNYGHGNTAKYGPKVHGTKRRRRKSESPAQPVPQIWVTMMVHLLLRTPWCWKTGPSNSSERADAIDLISTQHFAKNTLFVADAGYVGYELWTTTRDHGHHFLVRVGANVSLLSHLCDHDYQGKNIFHVWPKHAERANSPPLAVRLIECRTDDGNIWLLTSVLQTCDLTDEQAREIYKLRWGLEIEFRTIKQTFTRRVLRSRKSERAHAELSWSILALAVLTLFTMRVQKGVTCSPKDMSVAGALNAIRLTLRHLHHRPSHIADLISLLKAAVQDTYQRKSKKASRHKLKQKHPPSCCRPNLRRATKYQRMRAAQVRQMAVT